jgi:hypothetical protein
MKPPVPSGAGGLIRSVTGCVTGGGILTRAAAQAMLDNGLASTRLSTVYHFLLS